MSFLSKIAEWASKIPLVGPYIADLIERVQNAIESWTEPLWHWISVLRDWFYAVRDTINAFVSDPISFISDHLPQWLKNAISWLQNKVVEISTIIQTWVKEKIEWLASVFSDLSEFVYNKLYQWLSLWESEFESFRENVNNAILQIWDWILDAHDRFQKWLEESKKTIVSWVEPYISPLRDFISWFEENFREFLEDPKKYIHDSISSVINSLQEGINKLGSWVKDQLGGLKSAIMGINEFLATVLFAFIIKFSEWFLWSFLHDLVTLQYDPETKTVYGEPKNPVTKFLIYYFEMEQPKYEFQRVDVEITAPEPIKVERPKFPSDEVERTIPEVYPAIKQSIEEGQEVRYEEVPKVTLPSVEAPKEIMIIPSPKGVIRGEVRAPGEESE